MTLPVVTARPTPAQRASVDEGSLRHRQLLEGDFWRRIPAFRDVSEQEFLDHKFQARQSITKPRALFDALRGLVSESFIADVEQGFRRAPMSMRVSPYVLSLIDWSEPVRDPLRKQFIPLGTQLLPDHPKLGLDSLSEQADSPVPAITHRYPDKVLFLPLNTCPVYCRFCTRSYAVGPDTDVEKLSLKANLPRWEEAIRYIKGRTEVEDVVVSGGDAYTLKSEQLRFIGDALLEIDHVRRIRIASKGPAVMPQKLLSDDAWFAALTELAERGRRLHKQVVLHTHFNHASEITAITQRAMNRLLEHGMIVRNQSVLQSGVNDDPESMGLLVRRLGYVNVQPYYVYQHDLVRGVEDLRTSVRTAMELEKAVRGITAGFNTPTFVVDAPGGGGKRQVHSAEHYDEISGVSVYAAEAVKPGQLFCYFDPIRTLPEEGQRRWEDAREHARILEEALEATALAQRKRSR